MKVYVRERQMRTAGGLTVSDITDEVVEAVGDSGVVNGLACVYTPHTTCCIRINEWESGAVRRFHRRRENARATRPLLRTRRLGAANREPRAAGRRAERARALPLDADRWSQ